jgi:hypothetical protein
MAGAALGAREALERIAALYAIEKTINLLTPWDVKTAYDREAAPRDLWTSRRAHGAAS